MNERTELDCTVAGAGLAHRLMLVRVLADLLRRSGRGTEWLDELHGGVLADVAALDTGPRDDVALAIRRAAIEELTETTSALHDALRR